MILCRQPCKSEHGLSIVVLGLSTRQFDNVILSFRYLLIFPFRFAEFPEGPLGAEQLISPRPRRSSSSSATCVAEVPGKPPPVMP